MKNNIRYKGNTSNSSVIIFLKSKSWKLPAMVLCLGELPRRVVLLLYLHFIFISSFHFHFFFDLHFVAVVVLRLFMFFIHIYFLTLSLTLPWTIARFLHSFYTFSPAHLRLIRNTFISIFPGSSCRERYSFEWAFFTHRRFLPYDPLPTFLTQPAFAKAFLGAGSSSLMFSGLHADPWNTDLAHLFVLFTVIHNLHILNDSYLSSTIY